MGGGARAAYQVGVLRGVAALLRGVRNGNPFPILCGASAGAINAAALASGAHDFHDSVARLGRVWENFHAGQVYRSDLVGVVRTGAPWMSLLSVGWLAGKYWRARPRSLLDNEPLRKLLREMLDIGGIERALQSGHLRALAVGASSYSSGRHVTFYQALAEQELPRSLHRISVRTRIGISHLLASAAIPIVFPAVPLDIDGALGGGIEYFGDGSMQQISPTSPAIHFGAERLLVIGVGQNGGSGWGAEPAPTRSYPSLAQVAGHALSTIFFDALAYDVEQLDRMNELVETMSPNQRRAAGLRPVEMLMIAPSVPIDEIALNSIRHLPKPVRSLLESIGADRADGAALASYLLFEAPYTRALIDLGLRDAMAKKDALMAFFTERVPG